MMRRLLCLLILLGIASPAAADYQVRGRFLYRDRGFTLGGLTGSDTDKPVRSADVQVVDAADNVLASAATGQDGSFTLQVSDTVVRNVRVRVLTQALGTATFKARVLATSTTAAFAVVSPTYSNHDPAQDIDFTSTPVVAQQGQGGEAFNIFDQMLDAFDFIAVLRGARPSQLLTAYWAAGSSQGTYFNAGTNSVYYLGLSTDSDGYDDTVILHEIGHYTETAFSATDTHGGPHSVSGYYDLTLTWSEGYATFFANMVRAWRGEARPEIYVDTPGQTGPQAAFLAYEVETPSVGLPGANNEVAVNAALWDVVDLPATADATPGTDDDPLALADGPARFWKVFTEYIRIASTISIEDFWDGWFSPSIANGSLEGMRTAFGGHGIEYFPDAFEADDDTATARTVVAGSAATHHTLYGAGDQDLVRLHVVQDSNYTLSTGNLLSAADTRLQLYSPTMTLLAENDDQLPGDPASLISYTPAVSGTVYLLCTQAIAAPSLGNTYGSYDLHVTARADTLPLYNVQMAVASTGVSLQWHMRPNQGLAVFQVDRAAAAPGPWQWKAILPVVAGLTTYAWLDSMVSPGDQWFYRIVATDSSATQYTSGPYEANIPALIVPPARLVMHAPAPNPFNPNTTLHFELPQEAAVTMRVYAADGRLVRTLLAAVTKPAGPSTATWDGRDDTGRTVSSGIYVVQMDAGSEHASHRAVLLR